METLDEVIKNIEAMWVCPSSDGADEYCELMSVREDALHYLKEYRTTQTAYIKAMADLDDNPQLSWDELKQMEGKPVWVEYNLHLSAEAQKLSKAWFVISGFQPLEKHEMMVTTNQFVFTDYDQFSGWQAYRKERE